MSFRYFRRINIGNGLGLNISKSGVSTSVRTIFGSFGFLKVTPLEVVFQVLAIVIILAVCVKGKNDAAAFLVIMHAIGLFYLAAIVL